MPGWQLPGVEITDNLFGPYIRSWNCRIVINIKSALMIDEWVCSMPEIGGFEMRVFRSSENDGYVAVALDLPGCCAFGKTWPEALTELQGAMIAWIIMARSGQRHGPLTLLSSVS
jgi:predicted RNase H-like HicB family nuclease